MPVRLVGIHRVLHSRYVEPDVGCMFHKYWLLPSRWPCHNPADHSM